MAQLLLTAAVLHLVDTEPDAPFSRLADLLSGTAFDQIQSILTNSKSKRARDIASAKVTRRMGPLGETAPGPRSFDPRRQHRRRRAAADGEKRAVTRSLLRDVHQRRR